MSEWGNNPPTWEAIATVVTAISIILAVFSFRETRAQRRTLEKEVAVRMRPWIGLFNFSFATSDRSDGDDSIQWLLRNVGPLPAQNVHVQVTMQPTEKLPNEPDNKIHWLEPGEKTLMPDEDGTYGLPTRKYAQFAVWREAGRDVAIEGTVDYTLGAAVYRSKFWAAIRFSAPARQPEQVPISWRNQEVV